MTEEDYKVDVKRLNELQDIENDYTRCDEFNELLDKVIAYEDENNIPISR